jgi:hypothetical protein
MMRRFLFAALVAVACGGDSTSPTATLSAGTYTLKSIAGRPLPVVLGQGSPSLAIVADSLTIANDEAWSEVTAVQVTQNGQTMTNVTDDNGTWVRSGNTLTLTSVHTNTVVYSGSFSATELDLSDGTLPYVFTK